MAAKTDTDTMYRLITDFFERSRGKHLLIQTHDIPDPDALASAEGFRELARSFGLDSTIIVHGVPQRRENLAMIRETRISVRQLTSLKIRNPERYRWVFMDCLPGNRNVTLHSSAPGRDFLAVDHHQSVIPDRWKFSGTFITHPDVGATATLVTKLLTRFEVPLSSRLATALSYAIITDTMDFSRGTSREDLESFEALFPKTNQRQISRIRNAPKPRQYYRTVHDMLDRTYFHRNLAWVNMGAVSGGEIVAEMADFILMCENITWSLALGRNNSRLLLSLRSSNPRARCGEVIAKLLNRRKGAAGGHDQFAGGFIEMDSPDFADAVAGQVVQHFARIILRIPHAEPAPSGQLLIGAEP
jgi:nanoRNase/pAp phosphatase (c-di-AMP/oligoRNAs hydrolase)